MAGCLTGRRRQEYTLAIFLDVESTFNNVDPDALVGALGNLNLVQNMVRFIDVLLKSRLVTSAVGPQIVREWLFKIPTVFPC